MTLDSTGHPLMTLLRIWRVNHRSKVWSSDGSARSATSNLMAVVSSKRFALYVAPTGLLVPRGVIRKVMRGRHVVQDAILGVPNDRARAIGYAPRA